MSDNYKNTMTYLSNTTQSATTWSGSSTHVDNSDIEITTPYYYYDWNKWTGASIKEKENNKKGDDDMRYLYEVILVNPKDDDFFMIQIVKRSETSALMEAYEDSQFKELKVKFDDLKTSCRELMSWKKEKSLKKAIETIKEAVE